jgi:hypothetical protein
MASILKVDKLDPQSGTALEIGTSGDTVTVPTGAGLTVTDEVKTNKVSPATGTAFALGDSGDTFTVPSGATLDISASTLTPPATMPASSGVNLTALNASNLGSGTVPTARLGTGTASSSTFLRGDQTYAAPGGGKVLQVVQAQGGSELMTSDTFNSTGLYATITPASTDNAIIVTATSPRSYNNGTERLSFALCRGTTGEGSGGVIQQGSAKASSSSLVNTTQTLQWYDLPSSTSANTYTVMHKNDNNSTLTGWFEGGTGTSNGQIILMEIEV